MLANIVRNMTAAGCSDLQIKQATGLTTQGLARVRAGCSYKGH